MSGDSNHSSYTLNISILLCKIICGVAGFVVAFYTCMTFYLTLFNPVSCCPFPYSPPLYGPRPSIKYSLLHLSLYFFLLSVLIFLPSFSWSSFYFLPTLTHWNLKMSTSMRKSAVFVVCFILSNTMSCIYFPSKAIISPFMTK